MLRKSLKEMIDAADWLSWLNGFASYKGRMSKDKDVVGHGLYDKELLGVLQTLLWQRNKKMYLLIERACKDPRFSKSVYHRDKVFLALDSFMGNQNPSFLWNDCCKMAISLVRDLLKKAGQGVERLEAMDLNSPTIVEDAFSNLDASMGFLFPGRHKIDDPELIVMAAKALVNELPDETYMALAMYRVQLGNVCDGEELTPEEVRVKERLIWCIDAATVLVEALYARPFTDRIMVNLVQYAGGKDPAKINDYMQTWRRNGYWLCIDYSKYDSTIPSWLIAVCFDLVKEWFGEEHHNVINWLCKQFTFTKIWTPNGVKKKNHGIPSGSYFTQIVGSLANLVMVHTYFYSLCGKDKEKHVKLTTYHGETSCMVMGDDNIMFTSMKVDIKHLSTYLKKNFGVDVSTDKEKIAEGGTFDCPHFLKREWRIGGAWRNPLELFVNMVRNERMRTYDCYSPYHIIYGYMVTYPESFKNFFSKLDVVEGMGGYDELQKLEKMRLTDMPGSLKVLVMTIPNYWKIHNRSWAAYFGKNKPQENFKY
jgi:hypothetical protein